MEKALRVLLKKENFHEFKSTATTKILKNGNVLHYWSDISMNWEEEESTILLQMLTDLYITMQGFSFASTWIEKYKIAHKKNSQKTKGTRKLLFLSTKSVTNDHKK